VNDPQSLLASAVAARAGSYSPYSQFAVGAALLDADGRVWTGANVENASYGLSMCAERAAVFHAVASGVKQFVACAVAGPPGVTTTPCGACRQVLNEFGPRMPVYYEDENGTLVKTSVDVLLPGAFGPAQLDEARR
jgi:cytidine deaminase